MTSRHDSVQKITGARRSLSEDIRARQTRYLLSMGVRTICFVLAVFTSGPLRWVLFSAAVILPYIAVVVANGGREPAQEAPRIKEPDRLRIDAPPAGRTAIPYDDAI
jgi:hypothetical protein